MKEVLWESRSSLFIISISTNRRVIDTQNLKKNKNLNSGTHLIVRSTIYFMCLSLILLNEKDLDPFCGGMDHLKVHIFHTN